MVDVVKSRNDLPIRLTRERWAHIAEEHGELAGLRLEVLNVVAQAERVFEGSAGELLASREVEIGKWLIVVYREEEEDGFIITAFLTRKIAPLERRKQLWP